MSDLAFDHAPGLPEALPPGEKLLWQGRPDWKTLALGAYRLREISAYFALLAVWRAGSAFYAGGGAREAAIGVLWLLPLAVLAMALLSGLAWLSARMTIYSLTDKRVVMRIGAALPVTLNLPYTEIESASLARHANGCGDVPLVLKSGGALGYFVLWPHARPFAFRRPEPMLRALPDAERVAMLLGEGLRAAHEMDGVSDVAVKQPQQRGKMTLGGAPALAS